VVWFGAALAAAGIAGALVAWVGLDRANAYLGVPAAVAALVGLGLALYTLARERSDSSGVDERRVKQRAKASGRGKVRQVGGHSLSGTSSHTREAPASNARQTARARGDGDIEQIGGDRVGGSDGAKAQ